jgi:Cu2+-containing amine oxidase
LLIAKKKVGYADPQEGGRRRPVLHRASIAEMAVPYAGARV